MIQTEAQAAELLQKMGYGTHGTLALEVPGCEDKAFVVEVKGGEGLDLWSRFRAALDHTEMWPVLYACWGQFLQDWRAAVIEENIFMRQIYEWEGEPGSRDVSPDAIVSRADEAMIADVIAGHDEIYSKDLVEQIVYSLEQTEARFGKAPPADMARDLIAARTIPGYLAFERWLLDWEIENASVDDVLVPVYTQYIDWFEPMYQVQILLLLPTVKPWEVPAFVHWYGAESVGSEAVIALLQKWHRRYGAELVAHYSTMLQFNVGTLPRTIGEAFDLAVEQEAFSPCTTVLPGVSLRDHARTLLQANRWFLHERP